MVRFCVLSLAFISLCCCSLGEAAADISVDEAIDEFGCSSVLLDQGANLGDGTPVVITAEDAELYGRVKVRVFDQVPDGSLDNALAEHAEQCGWLEDQGVGEGNVVLQPDVLLMGVSVSDKATRLLYGEQWAPALDDSVSIIVDRFMNSQFAKGDYVGGLVAGLEQVASRRGDLAPSGSAPPLGGIAADPADSEVAVELVESAPEALETSGAVSEAPTNDLAQDSNLGVYALIVVVLVAVAALPVMILRRSSSR